VNALVAARADLYVAVALAGRTTTAQYRSLYLAQRSAPEAVRRDSARIAMISAAYASGKSDARSSCGFVDFGGAL